MWVYYTGKVIPFTEARHVIDPKLIDPKRLRTFISVDYGYDHPGVAIFWARLKNGLVVIFDEVYTRLKDTSTFVDDVMKKVKAGLTTPQ